MAPDADTPDTGESWARWYNAALRRNNMNPTDFSRYGVVGSATAGRWAAGGGPPKTADLVIETAHLLAPDDVAAALVAAGYPKTAAEVRAERVPPDEDPTVIRIRRESALSEEERARHEADYLRRREETAHYFELLIAERVRQERAKRRARLADDEPNGDNGRAVL